MAVCIYCNQEMTEHLGCTQSTYDDFPDRQERARIPYGSEPQEWTSDPCHDCGAPKGSLHHPGCDVECCPRCGGQAIACYCTDDEE